MKNKKILLGGLEKFVDERNSVKVRTIYEEFHESELYKEIQGWSTEKVVLLLRLLKPEEAAELFSEFPEEIVAEVIQELTKEEIGEIFDKLYTDEAIDIIDELPTKITRKILAASTPETRVKINKILQYEKNQIGYHMVVDYVAIPNNITFKKAKELVKEQIKSDDLEIIGFVYVFEKENGKFKGYLTTEDLLTSKDTEKINKKIEKIEPLSAQSLFSEVNKRLEQYDVPTMPVVNHNGRLVGVIEADDVIEQYDKLSDIAFKHSAIKVSSKNYFDIKTGTMFKNRVPWIIALLIIGTVSQIVVLAFQAIWAGAGLFGNGVESGQIATVTISSIASLAIATAVSISSSINDSAGNAGSQTSSTLVRAIALGQIHKGNYWRAIGKETIVAIYIGLAVMVTAFLRIVAVWGVFGYFGGYGHPTVDGLTASWMMMIALIASVSFFLTIVIGNLVGSFLPILADRYNIDGAIFAGPVQTTIVDILTILVYFSLTTAVFVPLANSGYFDSAVETTRNISVCFSIMLI